MIRENTDRCTDSRESTRRDFLRTSGYAGAALGTIPIGNPINTDQLANTADTDQVPVRQSIASLKQSDPDNILPTLETAVETLRNLDTEDPRNWDNLVEIHGTPTAFTQCEHGNWLFLPWHRAYLHYFEEIVREVTGNEAFALPYWNWLDRPSLPSIFQGPTDHPFVNESRTPQSTTDSSITGREQIEPVLSDPNFFRVIGGWADLDTETTPKAGTGGFEAPAHDYIHIRVGGDMARGNAPNDLSFWAHHSMMDRLWWDWNARGHPNLGAEDWLDYTFEQNFVDRDGNRVDISIREILGLPEQAFTYDTRIADQGGSTTPADQQATADVDLSVVEKTVLGENVEIAVDDEPPSFSVDRERIEPYLDGTTPAQLLLTARDVKQPRAAPINARVYLNHEHGVSKPSTNTTAAAGTYHFFVPPPDHMPKNSYVDLTEQLRERSATTGLDESVTITIAGTELRGQKGASPSATISTLSLVATQSTIDGEVVERPN